jgi:hypothetical protein
MMLHPWWAWPVADTAKPEAPLATMADALLRAQHRKVEYRRGLIRPRGRGRTASRRGKVS